MNSQPKPTHALEYPDQQQILQHYKDEGKKGSTQFFENHKPLNIIDNFSEESRNEIKQLIEKQNTKPSTIEDGGDFIVDNENNENNMIDLDQEFDKLESKNVMNLSKEGKKDIILKIGRYGIYLERGEEKANLPDEFGPENVSYDMAEEMFRLKAKDDESIGTLDGEDIFVKSGRFGSYLKCGDKNKGFPPNVDP